MQVVEFGILTDELRAELEGDERDPWDAARVPPMAWRAKNEHVALRDDRDGRLIASAGLLVAGGWVDGRKFEVVGLGGVIVNAAHRGQGLSLPLIEAALAKAATLGPEVVLLFCYEDRMGLYRRFGCAEVTDVVQVRQGEQEVRMPMRTMWRGLRAGSSWPPGPVLLDGPPF
jgi:predicted GNAT family N-acyltransferase